MDIARINTTGNSDLPKSVCIPIDTNEPLSNGAEKKQQEVEASAVEQAWVENKTADKVHTNDITCIINQGDHLENIVTDYWNISNSEFKQRFYMIVDHDSNRQLKIRQWLEIPDDKVLQFVRQRASLIAHVYSLKMEQDFWNSYKNLTRIETLWLSQMSENMIQSNNIDEKFLKTEKYMNEHLKTIEKQYKTAIEKLDEHLQERQQVVKLSAADMSLLSAIIILFVRQDRQQLRIKYEQKNIVLMTTFNDVRFIKEFYDLKPNSIQINAARRIWQTTIQQQEAAKHMNCVQRCMLDDNQFYFYLVLQKTTNDPTKTTLTVKQFKDLFLTEQTSLAQAQLENYAHVIENEKKKLLKNNPSSTLNQTVSFNSMLNITESRQRTLIQRIQMIDEFSNKFVYPNYNNSTDNDNDDKDNDNDDDSDRIYDDTD